MTEADKVMADKISIHAPRGGSDKPGKTQPSFAVEFQSTLPVGGATMYRDSTNDSLVFQSTLPVGGATAHWHVFRIGKGHFNPRSPWGERHGFKVTPSIAW